MPSALANSRCLACPPALTESNTCHGWRARRALPDWREHVDEPVSISHTERNGPLYPFSLAEKLERIAERHEWYTPEGVASSPWRRDPADPRAEGSASDEAHD